MSAGGKAPPLRHALATPSALAFESCSPPAIQTPPKRLPHDPGRRDLYRNATRPPHKGNTPRTPSFFQVAERPHLLLTDDPGSITAL